MRKFIITGEGELRLGDAIIVPTTYDGLTVSWEGEPINQWYGKGYNLRARVGAGVHRRARER